MAILADFQTLNAESFPEQCPKRNNFHRAENYFRTQNIQEAVLTAQLGPTLPYS